MVNFDNGYGPPSPPPSYNPMPPPRSNSRPISYPNMNSMSTMHRPEPFYHPRPSYRRYSLRRCRPVVRIIRSDSCSSISTCSSISSCSSRRYRSCSYTRECRTPQQQPVIVLPIQCQQQPYALPTISNISSTPMIMQPLNSVPHTISSGKPQQIQAGPIQYVRAAPTSQLQFTPVKTYSSVAPQRVLVNSTNKKQSTVDKPIPRSITTHI